MVTTDVSTPWLNPIYQRLVQSHQGGRLAHGLLFTGHDGLGKYRLATQLSKYLLCSAPQGDTACGQCHSCSLFNAQNHLDFHLLHSEDGKAISIDAVRALIDVLNERPNLGDTKVVVIKDAHLLSTAAANALLKTLEEPQGNSYIILLTRTHQQLIATLYSRVQHTHINSPDDTQLLDWLSEQQVGVTDKGVLRQFQNSPLVLLNYLKALQAGDAEDERRHCVEGLFSLLNQAEMLFDFSQFMAKNVPDRLQLLFFMLHEMHKIKLSGDALSDDAVYAFALPQLQIWSAQLSLKSLRHLCAETLSLRAQLMDHSGLKKELLISALLIKIKNEFKDHLNAS